MKTDQHPILNVEHDDLPSLTLVLPRRLDRDQTLKALVEAIGQARTDLVSRAWLCRRLEEDCAADGEPLRQALCRGQALGGEHAAATIDEAIIGVFGLWDQYKARDPWPGCDGTPRPASRAAWLTRLPEGFRRPRHDQGSTWRARRIPARAWLKTIRIPSR